MNIFVYCTIVQLLLPLRGLNIMRYDLLLIVANVIEKLS